jgi:flagellar biosynthesis/type III secretory pathway protein FliH
MNFLEKEKQFKKLLKVLEEIAGFAPIDLRVYPDDLLIIDDSLEDKVRQTVYELYYKVFGITDVN